MKTIQKLTYFATLLSLTGCAAIQPIGKSQDSLTPGEHVSLGNAYLAHQERKLAMAQYQAAIEQDKRNLAALVGLGNIAYEDHQFADARSYFLQALKAEPRSAGASNNLAMVYLAEGKDLNRAQRLIDEALPRSGPLAPYLWDTQANIALAQGRYLDAEKALENAEAEAPINDPDFLAQVEQTRLKLMIAARALKK